jgi:hypothetical protein
MSDTLNALLNAGHVPTVPVGGQVQFNPLAAITAGNQAAQSEFQTRALQAKQALGAILQQSTGPDGVVDYGRANALAARAGPIVQMGLNEQLRSNADLSGAQLSQARDLHGLVGNLATAGVQDTSDANWQNIRAQAVDARLPPSALAEIDRIIALPENQRAGAALPHVIANQDALTRLHIATGGEPMTLQQGGGTTGAKRSLLTGAITPAGETVPQTMTPEDLNAIQSINDPRRSLPDGSPNPDYGKPKPFTKRQVLEMAGNTVLPNGQVIPKGGLGTGRYPTLPPALVGTPTAPTTPAAPTTPLAPATPTALPTPPAPVGTQPPGTPVAIPPPTPTATVSPYDRPSIGTGAAEEEQIKAAGPRFDAEIAAGTQAQGQHALLANMLANSSQFATGPYANTIANWRARLAPVFNVDEKALTGAQDFQKLAAQLALQQAGSIGAGSDSRFAVTQTANPHAELSPGATDLIIRQLQGNADYLQARSKLAQGWKGSRGDYNGFTSSLTDMDPRVFQYGRMTDPQKVDYFKSMEPRAQRAFMRAHKWAEDQGLLSGG